MKKIFKEVGLILAVIFLGLLVAFETVKAIYAWDETMTDSEVMYYLEKYPDSERLNEIAEKRNLK